MAGEWVTRRIGSLGRVVTGKTPPTADRSNFGGPYPFITIPDLDGRVLIDRSERTLSEKGAETLRPCLLAPGSVMMSCIATVGRCGVTARPSFTNQQVNSVIPSDGTDSRFLYYVFTQLGHELESAGGGGSVYTNVSKSRFSDIEVELPEDVNEQRAIAHILGTLDDKIELNRRMNETLEAMARALFKSWFVDFLPVRAKMAARTQTGDPVRLPAVIAAQAGARAAGHDPLSAVPGTAQTGGLPRPLADLFPDAFEESELGKVPSGWEVGRWGGLVTLEYGKSLTEYANGKGIYPVFGTNGKIGTHSEALCDHPGIIIGRKGAYRGVHFCNSPFFVIDTAFYVEPKVGLELRWAYYELLRQDINSMDSGSAIPSTSRGDFYNLPVLTPPLETQQHFSRLLTPCWTRQEDNDRESLTLAALRDTLLPKLISGDLRVKDAERYVSGVV